jgi:PAS domain S-box-containing protein
MAGSDKLNVNKGTETGMRNTANHYRAVAEAATDAIITINSQSIILLANPAAEEIFGYSNEEMVGRPLTMLMPEYLRLHHRAGMDRYLKTGKRHLQWNAVQLFGLHRSGHEIPLEISFLEFSKDGQRFFSGIIRDITQRNERSQNLSDNPELLSAIIHQTTVGVSVVDMEGYFTFTNERYCEIVGRTREELLKISMSDVIHADDLPESLALFKRAREFGESFEIEKRLLRRDGSCVWVHNCESVLNDSAGTARGVVAMSVDISEQRTLGVGLTK